MMRTVWLYGALAKRFGKSFELEVSSVAEAMKALGCQLDGFQQAIRAGNYRLKCGPLRSKRGLEIDEDHLAFRLPAGDIHVVPVLRGAKNSGIGKILAGVLIAAVAWFAPAALGLGPTIFGGFTYGQAAMFGVGLALTGISQAIAGQNKPKEIKAVDQNPSFTFNSVSNTTAQGGPVPLIYGRTLVGSVVISAGISTEEYAYTNSGDANSGGFAGGWTSS